MISQQNIDKIAVCYENQKWTYNQWKEACENVTTQLIGETLVIVNQYPPATLLLFCAAVRCGIPATIIESEEIKQVSQFFKHAQWIESSKTHFNIQTEDRVAEKKHHIMYIGKTSGSTGQPKWFARSGESWKRSIDRYYELFALAKESTVLVLGKLSHSLFLITALGALRKGGTVVMLPTFSAKATLQALVTHPHAVVVCVPTMLRSVIQSLTTECQNTFIVGGAFWFVHEKKQFVKQCPQAIAYEFYGSSETSFISWSKISSETQLFDDGDVGILFPGVSLAKQDEVTYCKSDMLFSGYLSEEDDVKTSVTLESWRLADELEMIDGRLVLRGRTDRVAIVGGQNVSLDAVERAFASYVTQCAACKMKSTYFGEQIILFYSSDAEVNVGEIAKNNLAKSERPRRYVRVAQLPMLASGKVDYRRLEERV